jgi:hypothetical protein
MIIRSYKIVLGNDLILIVGPWQKPANNGCKSEFYGRNRMNFYSVRKFSIFNYCWQKLILWQNFTGLKAVLQKVFDYAKTVSDFCKKT